MEKYQSPNPGCQLSIAKNRKIIFSKAYGMADFESPIGEIQFIRGKKNEIVGLEISDSRAYRVKFDRMKN